MSHTRYNVGRDLVDFWGRMVYDNVVNQPNHTNKYRNNKINRKNNHRIAQNNKIGNRQQQKRSIDAPTFQGRGSKTHNTAQSILH